MSMSPVTGPLAEPLRAHARADTWFRLRSPEDLPAQTRDLVRRELELAAEGLWTRPGPALDAGILYARSAVDKVRLLTRLLRGGLDRAVRRELGGHLDDVGTDLDGIRDVGALEEVVDRLRQGTREPKLREGLAILGGRLTERRYRESAGRRDGEELGHIRERLEQLRDEAGGIELVGDGFDLLAPGLERLQRRARRELRRIRRGKDSARRHLRLMRRMRDLGYALRLVEPAWPASLCALGHEIDRVSGRLREADHLHTLGRQLTSDEGLAADLPPELQERLSVLRDRFRSEALNSARRILADAPADFCQRLGVWWAVWEDESGAAARS